MPVPIRVYDAAAMSLQLDPAPYQPRPIHPYRPPQPHAVIELVEPGSLGEQIGLQPGDEILTINGRMLEDLIDYRFLISEEAVEIAVAPAGDLSRSHTVRLEKPADRTLGVTFRADVFDGIRICTNNCDFCFVYQNRRGMRKSVYIKDDDYRLSFLHGDFITLTNLTERCWERILTLHLSPLYVSIHAVDPEIRVQALRNPDGALLHQHLQRLFAGGIEIHGQVVLTPGLNDGPVLLQTIREMAAYHRPGGEGGCRSLAIVPVGLTGHRARLPELRSLARQEAREVIDLCLTWQQKLLSEIGTRFVFPSDEMYLLAGLETPPLSSYEDLPQHENGVGMVSRMRDAWRRLEPRLPEGIPQPRQLALVTGALAADVLRPFCDRLNQVHGVDLELVTVRNDFFGEPVNVAGLLAGADIAEQMPAAPGADGVIIPSVALRGDRFIDDVTAGELARRLGRPLIPAGPTAAALAEAVVGPLRAEEPVMRRRRQRIARSLRH